MRYKALPVEEKSVSLQCNNKKKKGDDYGKTYQRNPILFGEDARRFEERMKQKRTETPEARERRLKHYHIVMQWMENGKKYEEQLRASQNS